MKNLKLPHLIIGGFVALVLILVVIAVIFMQSNRAAQAEDELATGTSDTIDPVSGLPVTEDAERNHDADGLEIAFIGFGKLVDRGISMQQVTSIQDKFSDLSEDLPEPIERVSLYHDSIERILPSHSGKDYHQVNFKVQVNQKDDYDTEIRYIGISSVDMTVTDSEGNKHEL